MGITNDFGPATATNYSTNYAATSTNWAATARRYSTNYTATATSCSTNYAATSITRNKPFVGNCRSDYRLNVRSNLIVSIENLNKYVSRISKKKLRPSMVNYLHFF